MKMTTRDVFVDVATLSRPTCESQRGDNIGTGRILYRRKTVPAARHGGRLWGRHEGPLTSELCEEAFYRAFLPLHTVEWIRHNPLWHGPIVYPLVAFQAMSTDLLTQLLTRGRRTSKLCGEHEAQIDTCIRCQAADARARQGSRHVLRGQLRPHGHGEGPTSHSWCNIAPMGNLGACP
jgi:hypothetical protein